MATVQFGYADGRTQSDPQEGAPVNLRHRAHCVGVYGLGFVDGYGLVGGLIRLVARHYGLALVPRSALLTLLDASNQVSGTETGSESRR